jgi:hypothetical protein
MAVNHCPGLKPLYACANGAKRHSSRSLVPRFDPALARAAPSTPPCVEGKETASGARELRC